MVDCKGNELRIGDEVVFVKGKNSGASLDTGIVTKFYKKIPPFLLRWYFNYFYLINLRIVLQLQKVVQLI